MNDEPRIPGEPRGEEAEAEGGRKQGAAEPDGPPRDPAVARLPAPEPPQDSLLRAAPGLARIAVAAAWNTAGWTFGASIRAGSRVARAAISGEAPGELFRETGEDFRDYARRLLGIVEAEVSGSGRDRRSGRIAEASTEALRERGAELLRMSADVHFDEDSHPAYARILADLTPDEARILRLLAIGGAQPSVDVRSGLPIAAASQLVALGLTMIGAEAGCRYPDRVQAYLNNLDRLGLTWFSREPVEDPLRYQVLEAQPEVAAALDEAGRLGRTVRRSIHLTPFGKDFCELCLPIDTAEFEALTGDGASGGGRPAPSRPQQGAG